MTNIEAEIRRLATPTQEEQFADLIEFTRDMDDPSKLHPELRRYVEENTPMAKYRLRHPLVYSVIGPLLPHQCNYVFQEKVKEVKRAVREKNWFTYLYLHERPYRMTLLEDLWEKRKISKKQLRKLLLDFWTDTEIPQGNQEEPLKLFRAAGFCTDGQESFDKLPGRMKLYRGVDGVCELTPDGPSWTRSRKVANFFAKRYADGTTYSIWVEKDDPGILAWITGREEVEIILDFDAPGTKLDRAKIKTEVDSTLDNHSKRV